MTIASAAGCAIVAFFLLSWLDVFERFSAFSERHEAWELDDAAVALVVAAIVGAMLLALRRGRALAAAQAELEEVESVPVVCAVCGRDELGNARLPVRATGLSDDGTAVTHTVCDSCLAVLKRSPTVDIRGDGGRRSRSL